MSLSVPAATEAPISPLHKLFNFYLKTLIWSSICSIAIVAYIDGFMIERIGFTRFETAYYVFILILLLMWLAVNRVSLFWLSYLILLLVSFWTGVLVNGMDTNRLIEDTRYYVRSYLLGVLTFIFFLYTPIRKNSLNRFFWLQWIIVVCGVFIHFLFGFGGMHSERGIIRDIYSGFFKEANVVSFFLVCNWYYLYCDLKERSFFIRYLITAITMLAVILMSSKASILAIFFLLSYHWLNYFKIKSTFRRIMANLMIFLFIFSAIIFFNNIIELFLQFIIKVVPDSAVIAYRLNTWDVITVLTSMRNLRILELFSDMQDYSIAEWLFGIGFKDVLEKEKLIESDPFDIIQAFGILGLIIFYLPIVLAYIYINKDKKLQKIDFRLWIFNMGIWYSNILVSTATGHVILTPMAVILLGLVFGYWWNKNLMQKDSYYANITDK